MTGISFISGSGAIVGSSPGDLNFEGTSIKNIKACLVFLSSVDSRLKPVGDQVNKNGTELAPARGGDREKRERIGVPETRDSVAPRRLHQ